MTESPDRLLLVKKALFTEHTVQGIRAMSLAQQKPVPVRICPVVRRHIHHLKIQGRKNVNDAQIPSYMAGSGVMYHLYNIFPQLIG